MTDHIEVETRKMKGRVAEDSGETARRHIEDALRGLRFGAVTIVVQDGVIVQVERTERTRFVRHQ
jgi:hypothetical protein